MVWQMIINTTIPISLSCAQSFSCWLPLSDNTHSENKWFRLSEMKDCMHQALSAVEENMLLEVPKMVTWKVLPLFLCPVGCRQHGELPAVWGGV